MARKTGSKNKYDGSLRDAIIAEFDTTPALELMRRGMKSPVLYARENGILHKGEPDIPAASARQERILKALLPYTEKKMPTEVQVSEDKRIFLGVYNLAPDGVEASDPHTIDMRPANIQNIQQNQELSNVDDEKSHIEKSNMRR